MYLCKENYFSGRLKNLSLYSFSSAPQTAVNGGISSEISNASHLPSNRSTQNSVPIRESLSGKSPAHYKNAKPTVGALMRGLG